MLLLGTFALLLLAGLCVPRRKCWNHELLAFPALALLAGAGAAPPLRRWLSTRKGRKRRTLAALALAALAAVGVSLTGGGRLLLPPPCAVSGALARGLGGLPLGSPVLVVAPEVPWPLVGSLAAERGLVPWPVPGLPAGARRPGGGPDAASVAVVDGRTADIPPPWQEVDHGGGWRLLARP